MVTCGWCGKHYDVWRSQCHSCGGPMPPPPGQGLGEPPPSTPRPLPKGFAWRRRFSHNVMSIIGIVVAGIGALFTLSLSAGNPKWPALLPFAMFLIGAFIFKISLSKANGILQAFVNGEPVKGKIHSVELDRSQSINNKHPWRVVYHFDASQMVFAGELLTFDDTVSQLRFNQPVWVLYLKDDPERNTIYPPYK